MRLLKILLNFDKRIARELRAQRRIIIIGLMCVVGTSLLTTATIPLTSMAVDLIGTLSGGGSESKKHAALSMLGWLSLGLVGMFLIKYFLTRGQTWFISMAAAKMIVSIRLKLFDKLQRLPISYFNSKRAGEIQSVLTNDVGVYQSAVMIVRDSIDGPIKAIGATCTVFYLSWRLALVALIFVPILAFVINRNGRKMKAAQAKVQDDFAQLIAMATEALQGARVIKAFAAEERIKQTYGEHVEQTYRSSMTAVGRLASLRPMVELIGALALGTVLYLCGWLALHTGLTVGNVAGLLYAMDVINQGFRTLGYANNTYNQVVAATDRIYGEILDVPEGHEEQASSKVLPEVKGQIEFRNVSFVYPDGTPALNDVSFTIEPGHSLALVGPSGAGKSTIADLLLRFYEPTAGQILLDGVDIRELRASWLRSLIGVVPQQTFLFKGSISDNIRLGRTDASAAEIEEAAHAAHADVFVDQYPARYDTEIGEFGVGLSGGERQRVAIARAIIRKPAILLLDEATSALDAVSEKHVQEALDEIMRERTTLFIAHRLTTAARADCILMLRRGQVLEYGSHRELMDKQGAYATMYNAFNSGLLGSEGSDL